MIRLREEKSKVVALELLPRDLGGTIDPDTARLQNVRAAAAARGRAIAVLRDRQAGARDDESDGGRDVDRVRAVATGSTRVDDQRKVVLDVQAARAHRLGRADDFGDALA